MNPLRVLFVDDEEELVSTVVERLELRGIKARGSLSGDDALRLIEEEDFDVVVLDVRMPGLGGLDVIRRIRGAKPDLAVIFVTGHGSEKNAEEGMKMGAFDYLLKPIDIEVLIKILRRAAEE